ncbi:MAG: amidohydrolase [Chloroflexi bacterium]|nr:amidohydrolase [Chloroflexota bacterium]
MYDLIIRNCHALIPSSNSRHSIQNNCDIIVSQGKITDICSTGSTAVTAHKIIEANEMLATPGLINTHAHAPMVIFRGLAEDVSIEKWFNEFMWPLENNLTEEDVYWGMLLALVEMIEGGVTTVADHYFFMDRAAQAVSEAGTRAALGWAVFGDRGYDALSETAVFAEKWQGKANGRLTTWMAPHAPYTCDDNFLKASVKHAKRLGIGIHIHASEEMAQTKASLSSRGKTPIQVLADTGILDVPTIIAHGCGLLPEDIALLKQANQVGIAHAPKTYLKLGMGLTPILALREAGIPVGLATDGAVSNNTLDIYESLRLMTMLQKHETRDPEVLTIQEALDITFQGSAATLGMADKIGRLETGFLADIILVEMSGAHHQPLHSKTASLVYNTRASDVNTVIVNGRILMQDRQLLTLNKAEIISQVNKNMSRLAQRIPGKRIQVYNP